MDDIASRLKKARKLRKLTQQQLAEKASVLQSAISNIENRSRSGSQSVAEIADALGVRYRWLRDGDGPMDPVAPGWPFETIAPQRIRQLTPSQRAMLEGYLQAKLETFESEGESGKRDGTRG